MTATATNQGRVCHAPLPTPEVGSSACQDGTLFAATAASGRAAGPHRRSGRPGEGRRRAGRRRGRCCHGRKCDDARSPTKEAAGAGTGDGSGDGSGDASVAMTMSLTRRGSDWRAARGLHRIQTQRAHIRGYSTGDISFFSSRIVRPVHFQNRTLWPNRVIAIRPNMSCVQ